MSMRSCIGGGDRAAPLRRPLLCDCRGTRKGGTPYWPRVEPNQVPHEGLQPQERDRFRGILRYISLRCKKTSCLIVEFRTCVSPKE